MSNGPTRRPEPAGPDQHVPAPRVWLDLVSPDTGRVFPTDGWAGVVAALEAAPDDVYEILDGSGRLVGSATADGRGRWHIWGGQHEQPT